MLKGIIVGFNTHMFSGLMVLQQEENREVSRFHDNLLVHYALLGHRRTVNVLIFFKIFIVILNNVARTSGSSPKKNIV